VKRLVVWFASTAAGVVMLFSYHTSLSGPGGTRVVSGIAPVGVVAETPGPTTSAPGSTSGVGSAPSAAAKAGPSAAGKTSASPAPAASAPAASTPAAAAKPSPTPAPKKTAATTRTINGAAVDTRYGPVQVQIKVQGSRIVSSNAIVYPTSERRDQEINSYAVPQLNDETVQAQSASIDTVSGATYTSDAYRQSLQSALDAAHL
jgi:uncharacterized protein with FMN-binding domain